MATHLNRRSLLELDVQLRTTCLSGKCIYLLNPSLPVFAHKTVRYEPCATCIPMVGVWPKMWLRLSVGGNTIVGSEKDVRRLSMVSEAIPFIDVERVSTLAFEITGVIENISRAQQGRSITKVRYRSTLPSETDRRHQQFLTGGLGPSIHGRRA